MAHGRPHDAAKIVKSVAKFNKHPESAQVKHVLATSETATKDRKYTVRDLFRSWFLVRITLLSAINWYVNQIWHCFSDVLRFESYFTVQAVMNEITSNIV